MNTSFYFLKDAPDLLNPRARRRFRTRNFFPDHSTFGRVRRATEALGKIFRASLMKGVLAAKQIAVPALVIQAVMLAMTLCYFFYPPSAPYFEKFVAFKAWVGPAFAFLSMGFIAIFAESLRRLQTREWSGFGLSAVFGFFVFGFLGVATDTFYIGQKALWAGLDPGMQIVAKVLTDQFIWTVLFANPYQTFTYVFKDCGFKPAVFRQRITPFKVFYLREVLAVLITNWAFWIPTAAILYSLPIDLQFVISRLAIIIWILLLTAITNRKEA